ncbi:hypothetical protein AVEN_7829-1 [Araneus ventricosus]|uniref:Uncharacterized protein n=1 Tax=Araneus ventricosus TaxID=182803 RepID=A0A4Y2F3W0_ARAVE|nr:hypothetical protein AVEN_7829-1 [Araneus ventricosus]
MFWGFIAVVIRLAEQRVVKYRPKDAYAITTARRNCTEVSVQSSSFELPIIYRCFARILQPSHKPSDYWNRVALRCKVEPQYSLRFFCWFGKPPEVRKELHPFVQKGCGSCASR